MTESFFDGIILNCILKDVPNEWNLTPEPILLNKNLRSQLSHWISIITSEILNKVRAKDFIELNLFSNSLHCERVWIIIQRTMFTEWVSSFKGANDYMLSIWDTLKSWKDLVRD
jgi:hypothetical protein